MSPPHTSPIKLLESLLMIKTIIIFHSKKLNQFFIILTLLRNHPRCKPSKKSQTVYIILILQNPTATQFIAFHDRIIYRALAALALQGA